MKGSVPQIMSIFIDGYRKYCERTQRPFVKKQLDPNQQPKITAYQGGYLLPTAPLPENIFKKKGDSKQAYLTNDAFEYFNQYCYKCGFPDCNPASLYCPYHHASDAYGPCTHCQRGLHLTKDCKWKCCDVEHAKELAALTRGNTNQITTN